MGLGEVMVEDSLEPLWEEAIQSTSMTDVVVLATTQTTFMRMDLDLLLAIHTIVEVGNALDSIAFSFATASL